MQIYLKMSYTEKYLDELLFKIDEICLIDENKYFKNSLYNKFNKIDEQIKDLDISISYKLSWIARHLKIDTSIIINYDAIENTKVRNQLTRDCIEMWRYRQGKVNEFINFEEFCRFAHLQAEELLNYFYTLKFNGNIESAIEFIKINFYNKKDSDLENKILPKEISNIDYFIKISAFSKAYKLDYNVKSGMIFLNKLRNETSHRNSLHESKEDKYLIELERKGIYIEQFNQVNTMDSETRDLYYKVKFIYDKRKKDFDQVISNLNKFMLLITDNIKQ